MRSRPYVTGASVAKQREGASTRICGGDHARTAGRRPGRRIFFENAIDVTTADNSAASSPCKVIVVHQSSSVHRDRKSEEIDSLFILGVSERATATFPKIIPSRTLCVLGRHRNDRAPPPLFFV